MDTKECFKCEKEKPLSEFYKHGQMADGHLGKCKKCAKKDVLKHRAENLDEIRAYDRKRGSFPHRVALRKEYQKTENGKIAGNKAKRNYDKRNPLRTAAKQILNNAIQSGKITKEPCSVCGSTYRIHGHHEDYYKPLDVIWFCPKHHAGYHKRLREIERANNDSQINSPF